MRAIITQRESTDQYGVLIDMLESSYIRFFESLGLVVSSISNYHNDIENHLEKNEYEVAILTGGGDIPPTFFDQRVSVQAQKFRNKTEEKIITKSIRDGKTIIGICRGMQFINGLFGGRVSRLNSLDSGRAIGVDHAVTLGDNTKIMVNNYHQDGIYLQSVANNFKILAVDIKNNVVESFYSNEKHILCVQWHPERRFVDSKSERISTTLIYDFINDGGRLRESDYFSGWTGE